MSRISRASDGQAALVDAILFMTIMLVASAVVLGASGTWAGAGADVSEIQQYARDFAETVLASEIHGAPYIDVSGQQVNLNGSMRSMGRLLCDEAMILDNGPGNSNFSEYNAAILSACGNIIRPGLGYAISCNDGLMFISRDIKSNQELPDTRSASQITMSPEPGIIDPVIITFYVWVI